MPRASLNFLGALLDIIHGKCVSSVPPLSHNPVTKDTCSPDTVTRSLKIETSGNWRTRWNRMTRPKKTKRKKKTQQQQQAEQLLTDSGNSNFDWQRVPADRVSQTEAGSFEASDLGQMRLCLCRYLRREISPCAEADAPTTTRKYRSCY